MYSLTLKQENGPFFSVPCFVELSGEKIALNNVILPRHIDKGGCFNPYNVQLHVIGHEFGAICAVWASNGQEAMDEACNIGLIDCLMCDDQNPENPDYDSCTPLGNASELFDLSHTWVGIVEFDAARDIQLIIDIIRASENQRDFVDDR